MAVTKPQESAAQLLNNDEDVMEIDLVELLYRVLEKAHWVLLTAVVFALIAGIYVNSFVTPMYTATSKLYVLNASGSVVNVSDLQIGSSLAKDYVEVFSNWHVHEIVIQRLGLNYSYSKMSSMISAKNSNGSRILTITATSPDPQEAKDLANTYADVAREFIAAKMGTDQPSVFEEARLPSRPTGFNTVRVALIAFVIGALLAAAFVVVMFIVDDRIRSAEAIEKRLGIPALGLMPEQKDANAKARSKKKARKAGAKR